MRNLSAKLAWDDLKFFYAVAENQTLTAAGRYLKVNHTTVSRHIEKLEEVLGVKLFLRHIEGYKLSKDGIQLYNKVKVIKQDIDSLDLSTSNQSPLKSSISISLTRLLLDHFLAQHIKTFQEKFENVELIFQTDNRNMSIVKREVDLSLRFHRPQEGEFNIVKLCDVHFFLYGHKTIAEEFTPQRINDYKYINATDDLSFLAEYQWLENNCQRQNRILQSNSQYSILQFINTGNCIGVLPKFAVQSDDIIALPVPSLPIKKELWLLVRADIAKLPAVKVFMKYLKEIFIEYKDKF